MYQFPMTIHWNGKNNHFRFSLSLFTFFTLRLFLEKWKSDFFTFQKRKFLKHEKFGLITYFPKFRFYIFFANSIF